MPFVSPFGNCGKRVSGSGEREGVHAVPEALKKGNLTYDLLLAGAGPSVYRGKCCAGISHSVSAEGKGLEIVLSSPYIWRYALNETAYIVESMS